MTMFRKIIGFLGLFLAVLSASPANSDDIRKAEQWFNRLTTYQANFTQVSSDGGTATGVFSLKRPYRSRFDYDDPVPLVLITTKTWLHVDEQDRREVTSYPVSETPLRLILSDPVRLRHGDLSTSSEVKDGLVLVTIEQSDGEAAGRVTMEFSQDPFDLKRWVITDANGITTSIVLTNAKKGLNLANKIFTATEYPDQQ